MNHWRRWPMKKTGSVFAAILLVLAVIAPAFAATERPAVPPKGTEGPDIRKQEPEGIEGPDIRMKPWMKVAAVAKPKVEPKGTEGPDIRKQEPKGIEGPDIRKVEPKGTEGPDIRERNQ